MADPFNPGVPLAHQDRNMSLADTSPRELYRRMIFTPDRSVLYVAVPKTGCGSIKTLMAGAVGMLNPADEDFGLDQEGIHRRWTDRRRSSGLRPEGIDAMLTGDGTFRFTSVRDPFERIVSCYLDKVVNEESTYILREDMLDRGVQSLAAFLQFVRDQPPHERDRHCRRQVDLCFPGDIAYDLIIRHETFAADLATLIGRLNVPGLRIPLQDPTKGTDARSAKDALLGPDERDLVREIYAADFEAFGYW
jgi:hypothetical protein